MKEFSRKLAAIPKGAEREKLDEAKALITRLRGINLRWNIPELDKFLTQRTRELFY